jgi:membrane protease YdiL (CAAX protease family)
MMVLREPESGRLRASVRALVPALVTIAIYLVALQILGQLFGSSSDELTAGQFLTYGALIGSVYVAMILAGVYAAKTLERSTLEEFGLDVDRQWVRTFGTGVAISLFGISISWWWGTVRGVRSFDLSAAGVRSSADPLVVAAVLLVFSGYFLLGNVYEEVVYRRIVIDNFATGLAARGLSTTAAVGLATTGSLIVFGLLHVVYRGSALVAVDAALTGTMFAFAYLLTGSLALPTGLHFGRLLTSALAGESLGVVEVRAIGDVTQNTLFANLEIRFVQITVVCLLVAAWVYQTRGTVQIAASVIQPHPQQSRTD